MKLLYLYCPINAEVLSTLGVGQLLFSDPKQFNDPFEFPDVISTEYTPEELHSYYLRSANIGAMRDRLGIGNAAEYIEKLAENPDLLTNLPLFDPKYLIDELHRKINELRVCCLCKIENDPVMWSHYADCHRGMVVGLNVELICNGWVGGDDVIYSDEVNKISIGNFIGNPDGPFMAQLLKAQALTKSTWWDYEQEYRLYYLKGEDAETSFELIDSKYLKFDMAAVSDIYFGVRTTRSARELVRKAFSYAAPEFWCMSLDGYQMESQLDTL